MPRERFRLGKYWIDQVPGSPNFYRFWYDARAGEVRKRTLKTADFEAAKIELAAIVLSEGSGAPGRAEDVLLVTALTNYWTKHSDHTRSRPMARQAGGKLLDFLGAGAMVSDFRAGKQLEFMRSLLAEGKAVGTVARMMTLINAALRFATREDESGIPLLLRAPQVTYSDKAVAAALNVAEPEPQNWHPDLDMLAEWLNGLKEDEEALRRFTILKLAFACRSEAAMEIGSFSLDARYRLVRLNPVGRRQTKKHRPTLPCPANLWPLLSGPWAGETFVGRRYKLHAPWQRARKRLGLPDCFIPNSLRHFMATELRHAHLRYGVAHVPEEEREMWLGHRRQSVHNSYGAFEPTYLSGAKAAVEAILWALNAKLTNPILRQISVKSMQRKTGDTPISRFTPRRSGGDAKSG